MEFTHKNRMLISFALKTHIKELEQRIVSFERAEGEVYKQALVDTQKELAEFEALLVEVDF